MIYIYIYYICLFIPVVIIIITIHGYVAFIILLLFFVQLLNQLPGVDQVTQGKIILASNMCVLYATIYKVVLSATVFLLCSARGPARQEADVLLEHSYCMQMSHSDPAELN